MRIRRVLRQKTGNIHLDNIKYYYSYRRITKREDPKKYRENVIIRWVNSGDDSNGLQKEMTLQEAIKEILASPYLKFYSINYKERMF